MPDAHTAAAARMVVVVIVVVVEWKKIKCVHPPHNPVLSKNQSIKTNSVSQTEYNKLQVSQYVTLKYNLTHQV
jgi:hypothetical protein